MEETCASARPNENEEEVVVTQESKENEEEVVATQERDSDNADESGEKYTELVSQYEAVNEKLRRERDELKKHKKDKNDQTGQNEEIIREMVTIKALLSEKNSELVGNRLEAALWHVATSMFPADCTTRRSMQGKLKHHRSGLTKSKKSTWVEIHVHAGKHLKDDYEAGYVTITYADSRGSEAFNQCQVTEVFVDESNSKELTFTVRVLTEGVLKELVFLCESEFQRDEWIKSIMAALAEVRYTSDRMLKQYNLKLQFSKKKIGLLIRERDIESQDEVDEKTHEANDSHSTKPVTEAGKAGAGAAPVEEQKGERPCELFVIKIVDNDLYAAGLQMNCVVYAINDTVLVGKVSSEQLKLLSGTPKPFTLTFTGRNFFNKKTVSKRNSILEKLVADGENDVKKAFRQGVKGTTFEQELTASTDKNATIKALLANQRRLVDLLQRFTAQSDQEQEEQEFKE